MKFWPFIQTTIQTTLTREEINKKLEENTATPPVTFYWGRTFEKPLWGKIKDDHFALRPVVPYWNISPVNIRGFIRENGDKNKIIVTLVNPHLRVIIPLVILAIVLLMFNYVETKEYDKIVNIGIWIVLGAYVWVIVPFQIQARKTLNKIKSWFSK